MEIYKYNLLNSTNIRCSLEARRISHICDVWPSTTVVIKWLKETSAIRVVLETTGRSWKSVLVIEKENKKSKKNLLTINYLSVKKFKTYFLDIFLNILLNKAVNMYVVFISRSKYLILFIHFCNIRICNIKILQFIQYLVQYF